MVSSAGTLLAIAIRNNPYDYEGMDKTERYLRENEWTGVGWYWERNGQRIAGSFGSPKEEIKQKKELKRPAFDWRKQRSRR